MTTPETRRELTPSQIAELIRRLEVERRRLLDLYDDSVERETEIPAGEAEDPVDRGQESWQKEEIYAERESGRARLLLVEEALARLEGGRYGMCQYCGEPIAFARLQAVPATRYCAEHAEQVEKRRIDERHPDESWPESR